MNQTKHMLAWLEFSGIWSLAAAWVLHTLWISISGDDSERQGEPEGTCIGKQDGKLQQEETAGAHARDGCEAQQKQTQGSRLMKAGSRMQPDEVGSDVRPRWRELLDDSKAMLGQSSENARLRRIEPVQRMADFSALKLLRLANPDEFSERVQYAWARRRR